jgi:hypothetical protein
MNERIKELMEEAGIYDFVIESMGINEEMEKFSELIVRECISIVDEQKECLHEEEKYWHDRDYGYALAVDDASKGIKQFFGVEE